MLPFIKKYAPKGVSDIVGQKEALIKLDSFIVNYKKQKKKAALLYGPSGVGKTSSVYALAKEHSLELIELNSSEFRNKENIQNKLGSAIQQQSLFYKSKVILMDDIEGLSGTQDRGGIPEILRFMEQSSYPIVFTVDNPYEQKFSSIKQKSLLIEFQPISVPEIAELLKKICKKESLSCNDEVLKAIARRASGDMRAAINDLEILSTLKEINKEALEELGMREKEDTIINALLKIFKSTDPKVAISAFEYVDEDLDQQFLWLDENLPYEYEKPEDLARAYDNLSRADIFSRRIKRWQHWRFLVYINALITAGVAVSKDRKYDKFVQYKPTGRLLKMWWAKQKSMKKQSIAEKIAEHTHTSKKQTIKSMPYFQIIFRKNKEMSRQIAEQLHLDKEEIEWLRK